MDTITFQQVLPVPLKDSPISGDIWNQSISFQRGEHYLIMADSGKGKSTFLNIIYGTRRDFSGEVWFDQQMLSKNKDSKFNFLRSHTFAYLFQDLRLFPNISGLENILLQPGCKYSAAEIELQAEELGVKELLYRNAGTMSLGQQQRIAMLRALSHSFHWLLLDEPFSHLDNNNASRMMQYVAKRCAEENAGILATSLGDTRSFDDFIVVKL